MSYPVMVTRALTQAASITKINKTLGLQNKAKLVEQIMNLGVKVKGMLIFFTKVFEELKCFKEFFY